MEEVSTLVCIQSILIKKYIEGGYVCVLTVPFHHPDETTKWQGKKDIETLFDMSMCNQKSITRRSDNIREGIFLVVLFLQRFLHSIPTQARKSKAA